MKYFISFFLFLVLPSMVAAYGYQEKYCSCGFENASKDMIGVVNLDNTGGMNIFYFVSGVGDQVIENLYSNVSRDVRFPVRTNSNGEYFLSVSANYNNNFALTCGPCEVDNELSNKSLSEIVSMFIGGLVGFGFIYTVGAKIF